MNIIRQNNLHHDPACQAWWQFNQADPLADTLGRKPLTTIGSPMVNTTSMKEGDGCLQLRQAAGEYLLVPDNHISLPLDVIDQQKTVTMTGWFQTFSTQDQTLYYRGNSQRLSLRLRITNRYLTVDWGNQTGRADEVWYTPCYISVHTWYHLHLYLDGIRKHLHLWLYHDHLRHWLYDSFIPASELWTGFGAWYIGADPGGNYFDGLLDETILFTNAKTSLQRQAIMSGTYFHPKLSALQPPTSSPSSGWRWNEGYWR